MIVELKQNKVDGILLEEPVAKAYVDKNPELVIANIDLPSDSNDTYGIILPKSSKTLRKKINGELEPEIKSGKINHMIQLAYQLSIKE